MPQTVAGILPPEILLHMLDFAATERLRTVEPVDAATRGARNELLLCTSLVCRAWAVASQYLLLRDLYVGSTTAPAYPRPEETLSIQLLLDTLAGLSPARKGHTRSLHLEMGYGYSLPYLDRYIGPGAPTFLCDEEGTCVNWAAPSHLRQLLLSCPTLQHLGITIADPQLFNLQRTARIEYPLPGVVFGDVPPLHCLRSLSFTFKTDAFQNDVPVTEDSLAEILLSTPYLVYLHIDTHYSRRSALEANETHTLSLPHLRELRAVERLPSYIMRANMPRLHTLIWRNPDRSQLATPHPFGTLHSLAISGDWLEAVPDFAHYPNLRELLVDGSDIWKDSSFWDVNYMALGVRNKENYLRHVLEVVPPGLDTFTLVESLSLRLIPRHTVLALLETWAAGTNYPRTFRLLRESGSVPPRVRARAAATALYNVPKFEDIRAVLSRKGVQVVTGETRNPFMNLFPLFDMP